MPRRPRFDVAGLLHHVMNRGLARRTTFETANDVRYFLALLALEARAGRIEILAFAILTTHFHLLLRSCTGELDRVMQRVLNRYVRYFNRSRRRDGPLFRGRYRAVPVRSHRHLHTLIRYIDQNAPKARLVVAASAYPYGSAALYVSARRPRWLATRTVDSIMGDPQPSERPATYMRCFGKRLHAEEESLLSRRMQHPSASSDDWDDLLGAAPPRVLAWMKRKARLADGTRPGAPYVGSLRVLRLTEAERMSRGPLTCRPSGRNQGDGWPVLCVGLLRDLAGLTYVEISRAAGCSPSMASRRVEQHARLLDSDERYAQLAATLAANCLDARKVVKNCTGSVSAV